jgi:phosphohistidine swiveling domain-containing protein
MVGMIALTVTGGLLGVAVDVYLIVSASLLLLQRAIVTNRFACFVRWIQRRRLGDNIVSLDDLPRLGGCGNKAYRLGTMRSQGFSVPQGIVLTASFLEQFSAALPSWRSPVLDGVWRYLGAQKLAVRSSGAAEDGSSNSFAGVFESVLNVDRARLEAAVTDVLLSFSTITARAYGVADSRPNIIIQHMVEPDYSGVLFTRDPAYPSHSLIELVEGTAAKLVSGAMTPQFYRFGRISVEPVGEEEPPIDLKPLIGIGRQLETLFGRSQDVEWAHVNGKFHIVQSRDITRFERGTESELAIQDEWLRVLDCAVGASADEIIFEQNELSEVLPRPTPLSLSLMQELWASGGSIDLACRQLGLEYRVEEDSPPYLVTIFGRLYVNKRQEIGRAPKLNALAMWRMNRISTRIEHDFTNNFLPTFLSEIAFQEAVDFDRLSDRDLFAATMRIRQNYVKSTSVTASIINIAADYYLRRAQEKLNARGMESARYLARSNLTVFERAIIDAKKGPAEFRRESLLNTIGHRSSVDYELAEPRYAERPADIDQLFETPNLPTRTRSKIKSELARSMLEPKLIDAVLLACSFQTLKEDAKHHSLREPAVLRRALLAVDRRYELNGLIFYLTFEEIGSLSNEKLAASLRSVAGERRRRALEIPQMPSVSSALMVRQMENYATGRKCDTSSGIDKSKGIRVSGSGIVEGRACVINADDAGSTAAIPGFKDGDIVFSRMVPSAWIPYFRRAGGFVCEVGGWLSHVAIVARELNVPLIVQAKGIQMIATGELIRLHTDGVIEVIAPQNEDRIALHDVKGTRSVPRPHTVH